MKRTKYTYRFLYMLTTLLLLGSCQLGKHYTRPKLDLPDVLDSMSVDTVSIGDYPWEQLYTDTTLQGLIRKTLSYNKDMLIAAARVKELAAMKRIDYANMFPAVGAKVYAEKEAENYGGNHYKSGYEIDAKASVSWELDLWGNLRWARDKSLAEFVGSVENQRALRMSLVAQVAQAYFELVALDNELSIVQKTVDARRESLHLARVRYEGGLTSETAFRQAQVELARTATLVPDLERKISLKENEIAFLSGEYPHHIKRSVLPEDVMLSASLPVGLPSALLERRPDIRQAEQAVIAANAAVGVAFTNLFPRITLTATYGSESAALSDVLKSPYHLLSANILQPIFAMGKNRAMLKAKKAACEQAAYAYEKAVLNAFKDAYNAIAEFIGYMDLLDAQRGYLDAQIGLSNAVRDKQISMVNLYKALGGGWQE